VLYECGQKVEVLGPIFCGAIHDKELHIAMVCDFWSRVREALDSAPSDSSKASRSSY
jgi:tRNA G26 N,N-dimethylase Trm1